MDPRMFYFGPLERAGHFLWNENGSSVYDRPVGFPWNDYGIDGVLQPGCYEKNGRWSHSGPENEGEALIHYKDRWTALSFWDRSVDTRGACNSTYFAEGKFTFEEMVELAKARFHGRWAKMKFEVRPAVPMRT